MEEKSFDIGIIGGGPAGYTAAINAGKKGLKTVLFEKNEIGGTCLNRGCIPTKAIMHSALLFKELKNSHDIGINTENISFDWAKIIERKDNIILKLRKMLELSIKNSGATIINSEAQILDKETIKDSYNNIYHCKKIILAIGSEPKQIKGLEFDGDKILSSDDILRLDKLPKSIVIIGSGAIGIEWCRILSALDVDVKLIEMADHLLPVADIEVSKRIERIFKSEKINFYLNNSIDHIDKRPNNIFIRLKSGEDISADKILVAVGRSVVNQPNVDNVVTIGDAFGSIQLAHFASKQALEEICNIKFDRKFVPFVVYGTPEIAWVGLREQDLTPGSYQKILLPISAIGKSHCDNALDGFIKILKNDDCILGVHIISKEASSLVMQMSIAMQNDIGISKLKEICFPHPTYSEGLFESIMNL
ncbi:NAD(P)/FAD-dependent oxidoreductase [bacterium]|nr:NAD(P)/FAD-dependent oxidoreductase [bacterium]